MKRRQVINREAWLCFCCGVFLIMAWLFPFYIVLLSIVSVTLITSCLAFGKPAWGENFIFWLRQNPGVERSQLHFSPPRSIVTVDIRLISHYLNRYLGERFPGRRISCRVQLMHNQIHIVAGLPKAFAHLAERELRELFDKVIGYRGPLFFSIE